MEHKKFCCVINRNESFASLQTQASFASAAKLMLNLQKCVKRKKETGRCPGGNTTGVPRLGVCGGSPGCQNTSGYEQPGWLNGTG